MQTDLRIERRIQKRNNTQDVPVQFEISRTAFTEHPV